MRLKKYLLNKYSIIVLVILAIVSFFVFRGGNSSAKLEYAAVKVGDVTEKVSVTGKILAIERADLAFEKSGVVVSIPHKTGDSVNRGDIIASLDSSGDNAALASAQAELAELTRGLRPQEYASDRAAVLVASTSLDNAKKNALTAARDGYVKAQSAVVNYADAFFSNAQSINPAINLNTDSAAAKNSIENKRLAVSDALLQWKTAIEAAKSPNDAATLLAQTRGFFDTMKDFMGDLSSIVNNLIPGNSGFSQATIDAYVTEMNTGLSILTQAITAVNDADTALKSAQAAFGQANDKFTLEQAGASAESIAAQRAKVAQAQAELAKDTLRSPIDGVVTRADPNAGEFIAAGQAAFAVQSEGAFKIEAFVPEADIAKVAANNGAEVTLDAYGSGVIFPAFVTAIDPAETVLEGVPTYKVTLLFANADARIRSGMTANTDILTRKRDKVLTVPSRAVIDDNSRKTVRVLRADGKSYDTVSVITGLKGSDGNIEIVSGLSAGQKVVTYVK